MLTVFTAERTESLAKSTNVGVGQLLYPHIKNAFKREYKPHRGIGEKTWTHAISQEKNLKN